MKFKFNFIRLMFVLFLIFILAVAVYQLYNYTYVSVSTEYATAIECEDILPVTGYFLRDEAYITSENSKYIDITVGNGDKVANGGVIANVYSTENSAKIQSQMRELQLRIDEIKAVIAAGSGYNVGTSFTNEIRKNAVEISSETASGNVSAAFDAASNFTSNVIKNKISNGEITDYSANLEELEARMSELKSGASAVTSYVKASSPGYFVSKADALTDKLSLSSADALTEESFENIVNACTDSGETYTDYIGKLVSSSSWRVCFSTESEKLDKLKVGASVHIRIPSVTDTKIKCTVDQIFKSNGVTYAVLESNIVSGDILSQRNGEIDLIIDTYSGLRVDKNAIRKIDGEDGVYVKMNGILKYRKVEILYIGPSYAVVEYDPITKSGLQAYDEVVVKGAELYDGKVAS